MRPQQDVRGTQGAADSTNVILLDSVTKAYQGTVTKAFQQGGRPALANVSVTVAAGEVRPSWGHRDQENLPCST